MKSLRISFPIAMILLVACSSIKISHNFDQSINFSEYNTYSLQYWSLESNKYLSNIDKEYIEKAFIDEFNKRHLKFMVDEGELKVSLFIVMEQETDIIAYTNYYNTLGYEPNASWAWESSDSATSHLDYNYPTGTLICNVFDTRHRKLIWQGIAAEAINEKLNNREKTIPLLVSKIMNTYPIPTSKN